MAGLIHIFPGGTIEDNEASTALVNNTAATRTITVPARRVWLIYGGYVVNKDNVARNIEVVLKNSGDKVLIVLATKASVASDSYLTFPNTESSEKNFGRNLIIADSGMKITITWSAGGASAGGTARSSLVVQELVV